MKTKLKTFSVWYSTSSEFGCSAIREVRAKNKIDLMKRLPMKVKFNIIQIKKIK